MNRQLTTWGAVVLLAAAGGAAWMWTRSDAGTGPAAESQRRRSAVAVETAPVETATLRSMRRFSGTLDAAAQFQIAPKVSGRLDRLTVDIGDTVRNGQVVARLDDDEYVQQVDQARAELGVARAGLVEARSLLSVKQRQYDRFRQLHERRIASDAELETAQVEAEAQQARVQVAQAQVTQREAALRGAEVRLSYTVIRATWSGASETRTVGERFANEGDLLAANQPLLSIVDLRTLTGVVYATERDYPRLREGLAAVVTADAYPERRFAGRIARLAPVFRETSRQARVEVEVENPDGVLKPGMFANVEVEVERVANATAVPLSAVVTRDGRTGVFLVDAEQRRARFVAVRTGIVDDDRVHVLEPEFSGRVVTLGNHLLSDGVPILLVDDGSNPDNDSGKAGKRPAGKASP